MSILDQDATDGSAPVPEQLDRDAFRRGYGTYEVALDRLGDGAYTRILERAIEAGYRHFDTAQAYDTEPHVARAIARNDLDASEVFVATKLHWSNLSYDDATETARESREALDVDTIDLLYVHVPTGTYDPAETLPALDALVDEGVVDRIGLSNFTPALLEEAIDRLETPVFAHQIEMHPLLRQDELYEMAVEDGHWIVAFSPYMKGLIREIAELRAIAEKHGTTPFDVSLGWLLDHPNVAVLSHSTDPVHMRENRRGPDVALNHEDHETIASIDRAYRMWNGRVDPWNQSQDDTSP